MKILIIEDDAKIASFLEKGFREEGFGVDRARDGKEGLAWALGRGYDIAVIDLMLPGVDGLSVIETMRARSVRTPVIILSARSSVDDRIKGLQTGGDDYLVKPFSFSELLARVQALVRRTSAAADDEAAKSGPLRCENLELDPWKREVRRGEEAITLHAREFALLELLMRNAGRVVTKTSILEHVYDYSFDPQTNVVDVLVHRVRKKVDGGFERKLIHTVRGVGYVLKSDAA